MTDPSRRRPEARVWCLIAVLTGAAAVLHLGLIDGVRSSASTSLGALAILTAACLASELCVVHVTIGREATSFAFGEIPFVAGLFFVSPSHVVIARVVGGALALATQRRQAVVKFAFNVAQWWFSAVAGVVAWQLIGGGSTATGGRGWLGAFVAALVVEVVSVLSITVVIALRGGAPHPHALLTGLTTTAANACFGLVATNVLRSDWRGSWALAVVAVVLGLAQHAHITLLRRHDAVQRLQAFTGRLGSSDLQLEPVVTEVLTGTREMLEVATVRLELWADGDRGTRAWLCDAEGVRETTAAQVAIPATLPAGKGRGRSATVDALAVHLPGAAGPMGTLSVSGRLGDVAGLRVGDQDLLETLAGHAAVALHNGRLAEQLRDQVHANAHQALHDALTGLPNRMLFDQAATDVLARGGAAAVLLLDLDRFKEVNDTLGHAAGDTVLRDVGSRLRHALRDADCVARLGGDEFAVVLADAGEDGALRCAERIGAALGSRLDVSDVSLTLDASIGIALAPEHGTDVASLLRRADVAMYAAKGDHSTVAVYAPERDHYSTAALSLVGDLRESIRQGELTLAYQPKTSLQTGGHAVAAVEALVRWAHPTRGMVMPDEFIGVAEQTGLIGPLTDWVLRTALAQCREWLDAGLDVGVAVNISPRILRDGDFPDRVTALLTAARVPAAKLTLEITEGALMDDPEGAIDMLWDLRRAGVRLAVDDLGVGHSSLAYLKRLPVHEIKIDKSFVMRMVDDPADEAIVTAVIAMVHKLGMEVVAEGVEDERTWRRLAALRCDTAQGYWMSRPLPAGQVPAWFRSWAAPTEGGTVLPLQRGRASVG